jgi:hypothetical protein
MTSNNEMIWSAAEFTQAAAQALASQPGVEIVSVGELTLNLRVNGRELTSDLEHFYYLYREAPDDLPAVQAALIEALIDQPPDRSEDDPAILLDRVLPMLKPLALLEQVRAQGLPMLVYRPLVGELMISYVIDEGQSVAFINEEHLARWGVSEAALYRRALANLRARPWQPHPGQIGNGKAGLLIFNGRDGYDATRLLLPELFSAFAASTPGTLVIGVPNRDFLIAFSDADPRVFEKVRAQIDIDLRSQPHPLSSQLLALHDGQLQVYEV